MNFKPNYQYGQNIKRNAKIGDWTGQKRKGADEQNANLIQMEQD